MERELWKLVKKNAPGLWVRIENPIGPGTPDCLAVVNGVKTVLVELKDLYGWHRDLGLRPEQRLWIRRWCSAGGEAWVFVRVRGIPGAPVFILLPGTGIVHTRTRGHAVSEMPSLGGEVWHTRVDWDRFGEVLCTGLTR